MKPREFYEAQARKLIKELRESEKVSYEELALRLKAYGLVMSTRVLINRINRGTYSFAFALMAMDAMGVVLLETPKQEDLHPSGKRDGRALTLAALKSRSPNKPVG